MQISRDEIIKFILTNNPLSKQEELEKLSLTALVIMKTQIEIEKIHRPKRAKVLPNVLSKEEVKAILEAPTNVKHKMMLSLIYSCGLRCGELLALEPKHIDSKRNIVLLKNSKGKKDRIAPLSPKILELLRAYYVMYKPVKYLFEGNIVGEQYSEKSLQSIIKQSIKKAGINKPVTLHWLRHLMPVPK